MSWFMRFKTIVSIALGFALCAVPAAALSKGTNLHQPTSLKFVDLTGAFDQSWRATAALPDDTRAKAFESDFAKVLPGFYEPKRVAKYMSEEQYQDRLLRRLKAYPEKREGIQRVSQEFSGLLAPALKSFEKAFGPMRGYPPIYLVNSLGEFDGGTRELPEGTRLLFGADVIDLLYKDKPIQPFFHHELFHLFHGRSFKECEEIWCNLWTEGLAVYVASRLNPSADDEALSLNNPVPLRSLIESHKQAAVCAVRARLNSADPKDYAPLFTAGGEGLSPALPVRFGYYVGFLVAQDLGRTRSLRQLASLRNDEMKPLIVASLDRMATCVSG